MTGMHPGAGAIDAHRLPTRPRLLLVSADGALGGGSLLVLQSARHLRPGWDVHLATAPGTWLAAEAAAAGIVVHPYPAFGGRSDPRPLLAVRRLVRSLRPAIVHAHGTRAMFHTALLGSARRRTATDAPIVVHTVHGVHALHLPGVARTLGLQAIRTVAPVADCTTFVSAAEHTLAERHALLARGSIVRVILNGTEDRAFEPEPEPGHVVFVGRMVAQKDPLLAARTAVELAARGHRVTMIGDGPLLDDVRAIVSPSPFAQRIQVLGGREARDTERIVSTADVAMVTSRWEGLPLVVLEALRYGIPVVAMDADGVREIVHPDSGGELIPPGDVASLADAVTEITGDRSERERRSIGARTTWEQHHRLDRCLDSYDALYRELLTGPDLHGPVASEPSDPTSLETTAIDCSVVIVNFNGGELVADAARSAVDAATQIGCRAEVIVVDNDSTDGSPEQLEQIPGVQVVRSGSNAGFPVACNTGLAEATGAFAVLLNPDARISPEALAAGLDVLRSEPEIGIVGVGQQRRDGRILPVTYRYPSLGSYLRRQLLARFRPDAERPTTTDLGDRGGRRISSVDGYLSGACLFLRRTDAQALGGLDPELFWAEDADLCRRFTQMGRTVALLPDLHVIHDASTTRDRFLDLALFQQYRGYLRYVHKHGGQVRAMALAITMATEIAVKWLLVTGRRDDRATMRRRAYRAIVPSLPGWAAGGTEPERLEPPSAPTTVTTAPRCPVCGGSGTILHEDLRDVVAGVAGRWSYARCGESGCGTVHPWPRPRDEDVASFYAGYHTHDEALPPREERSPVARFVRSVIRQALRPVVDPRETQRHNFLHLGDVRPGSVLELGCGNGRNLLVLRSRGWEVAGQEFDEVAAATARRSGIEVDTRAAGECWPGRSFDAVLLIHVAEHVTDLDAILRAAHDRLRPGGRVVVVTPNAASFGHRVFGAHWRGLEAPRHLQILTPEALRTSLLRAGLCVERSDSSTSESLPILRSSAELAIASLPDALRAPLARLFALCLIAARPRAARRHGEVCVATAIRTGI